MTEMLGVVKLVPVANAEPPTASANQLTAPEFVAVAPNTTVPVPQRLPSVTVTTGEAVTVPETETDFEVACVEVTETEPEGVPVAVAEIRT